MLHQNITISTTDDLFRIVFLYTVLQYQHFFANLSNAEAYLTVYNNKKSKKTSKHVERKVFVLRDGVSFSPLSFGLLQQWFSGFLGCELAKFPNKFCGPVDFINQPKPSG